MCAIIRNNPLWAFQPNLASFGCWCSDSSHVSSALALSSTRKSAQTNLWCTRLRTEDWGGKGPENWKQRALPSFTIGIYGPYHFIWARLVDSIAGSVAASAYSNMVAITYKRHTTKGTNSIVSLASRIQLHDNVRSTCEDTIVVASSVHDTNFSGSLPSKLMI